MNALALFPVGRLTPAHASDYRALMLEAYAREPDAFTATPEERAAQPIGWWEKRLDGAESLVFGAYEGPTLVGAIGLERESRPKTRHKVFIFGMYVDAGVRGQGVGGALLRAALAAARAMPGVRMATLTVSEGNRSAQALYERHGFRAFGTEPMAIREGERYIGKVHMTCDLEEGRADGERA